jgi:hypothetical protein
MHLPDNTVNGLINAIYPGLAQGNKPDKYFLERSILSSKNNTMDQLNQAILNIFPGQEIVTVSINNVTGGLMQNIYPIKFLNQQKASGLPLT